MDKRSSRDFISDLPLSIIHIILALVPIRDAVRTSILSKEWRYKWASLPDLVFDDECASPSQGEKVGLIRFIHQTLLLHEGSIQKFKLDVTGMERCSYTDQWLLNLSRNDIRELILNIEDDGGYPFQVHSSLYLCRNLTHLELFRCAVPLPPPAFKGFSSLRRLVLRDVIVIDNDNGLSDLPSDMIEGLVANSPLLEEVTLHGLGLGLFESRVHHLIKLRFRAPNLKCFYFKGGCSEICLYAPLLAKLRVSITPIRNNNSTDERRLQEKSPVCNYTEFLGGFTNLEELSVNLDFMKYLSIGIESCQKSLVFHHLRLLEIHKMKCDDTKLKPIFVHLITGAPNLHKLVISFYHFLVYTKIASVSSRDRKYAPKFTFERLKVIEMENVCGERHEMRFIKFLLESSPVLETMILEPNQHRTNEGLLKLAAELLRFHRASTNSKMFFRPNRLKAISSVHG